MCGNHFDEITLYIYLPVSPVTEWDGFWSSHAVSEMIICLMTMEMYILHTSILLLLVMTLCDSWEAIVMPAYSDVGYKYLVIYHAYYVFTVISIITMYVRTLGNYIGMTLGHYSRNISYVVYWTAFIWFICPRLV